MALYKLDDRGEAASVELMDWLEWYNGLDKSTLILAKHDIVERRVGLQKVIVPVDALAYPDHGGRVRATVVTKFRASEVDVTSPPWETGVEGKEPEYHTLTREDAMRAHKILVDLLWQECGGKPGFRVRRN